MVLHALRTPGPSVHDSEQMFRELPETSRAEKIQSQQQHSRLD